MADEEDSEDVEYVPVEYRLHTKTGQNIGGIEPGDLQVNGSIVRVRFRKGETNEDEQRVWHTVWPHNIERLTTFEEPVPVAELDVVEPEEASPDKTPEPVEDTGNDEAVEINADYLTDQTIADLKNVVPSVFDEEVLHNAVDEDDRVGATDLYEERLEELQE